MEAILSFVWTQAERSNSMCDSTLISDYGYAVTSHSSQGQTADRVLIHVDSAQAHSELLNSRMAYVSVSRAQYDVQMYTNDAKTLGQELSRDVSKSTALQPEATTLKIDPQPVRSHAIGLELEIERLEFERCALIGTGWPIYWRLMLPTWLTR